MNRISQQTNIGPKQVRIRQMMGVVLFVLAIGFISYLASSGAPRLWRLSVFVPFSGAILWFFETKNKICVGLAACSLKNMDKGQVKIEDHGVARQLKAYSLNLILKSFLWGALATAIGLLLP